MNYINIIRLRWVGHIERMEKERMAENILMREFYKISRRTKKTMGGQCSEGCIADRTTRRSEEMSWG